MSMRFLGELPPIVALAFAVLLGAIAWAIYFRGTTPPRGMSRWLLPALRSTAIALVVLLLTDPIWTTRSVVGELRTVRVVVDRSASMTTTDSHLPVEEKLRIAERLGWLTGGQIDWTPLDAANALADAADSLASKPTDAARRRELQDVAGMVAKLGDAPTAQRLSDEVVTALERGDADAIATSQVADEIASTLLTLERERLRQATLGDNAAVRSALSVFDQSSRWGRIASALAGDQKRLLDELAASHDVELVLVDAEGFARVDWQSGRSTLPSMESRSAGAVTNLAKLITLRDPSADSPRPADATTESNASSPAATVLLTDGRNNSGESPTIAAELTAQDGNDIFVVGYGGVGAAPDLSMIDAVYPDEVFAADIVQGTVRFYDTVPPGEAFVLRILHRDQVVWESDERSTGEGRREVNFSFSAERLVDRDRSVAASADGVTGRSADAVEQVSLVAQIVPLAAEVYAENNSYPMRLGVIVNEPRVLLIDGRPRWETRYIRNAFERDDRWSIASLLAGPGTENETLPRSNDGASFPTSRAKLFDYDLIILGELDLTLFRPDELTWIRDFVSIRGGGLILIDGSRGLLRQADVDELTALLPVRDTETFSDSLIDRLRLTDRGERVGAFRVEARDEANRTFWGSLPSPRFLAPVEAEPDAEVLLEGVSGEIKKPAIVTRSFGSGRVVYFSFDETWRWRYKVADLWHQRLWNQFARFAMPEPYAADSTFVSIDTDRFRYPAGDSANVRVRLANPDGSPATTAIAEARLFDGERLVMTVPLEADQQIDGVYRGVAGPLDSGLYDVRVRASGYSDDSTNVKATILVEAPPSNELIDTSLNQELLEQIAAAGNGRFLPERDITSLPELLEPYSAGRVVESELALGESFWWFGLVMLLLAIEWLLRKRCGLL